MDDLHRLHEAVVNNKHGMSEFWNQLIDDLDKEASSDEEEGDQQRAIAIQLINDDDDEEWNEATDASYNNVDRSPLSQDLYNNFLRRSSASYSLNQLFAGDEHNNDDIVVKPTITTVEKVAAPKVAAITRDSVARGLNILAKSARADFTFQFRMQDVPHKLASAAVCISGGASRSIVEECIVARNLSAVALVCGIYNKILACDIFLLLADYYRYVLKYNNEAADSLERAASCVQNDIRRHVGLLQAASQIYEETGSLGNALRIEKRLEVFDLSVDWITNSRKRQAVLRAKTIVEE
jgi:hypothetical protein